MTQRDAYHYASFDLVAGPSGRSGPSQLQHLQSPSAIIGSPASSISSITLSPNPSSPTRPTAAGEGSSSGAGLAPHHQQRPPAFWGFLEELTRRPEAARHNAASMAQTRGVEREEEAVLVEWDDIYTSSAIDTTGSSSSGGQEVVSMPLALPSSPLQAMAAPSPPASTRGEEDATRLDEGWWAKRSGVLDSSNAHKLNITSPPRRKT